MCQNQALLLDHHHHHHHHHHDESTVVVVVVIIIVIEVTLLEQYEKERDDLYSLLVVLTSVSTCERERMCVCVSVLA